MGDVGGDAADEALDSTDSRVLRLLPSLKHNRAHYNIIHMQTRLLRILRILNSINMKLELPMVVFLMRQISHTRCFTL